MKLPRNPSDPTPDDLEKHTKTHVPHRPWCPICVSARGREDKHYTRTGQEMELGLTMVLLDYAQVEDVVSSLGNTELAVQTEQHKETAVRAEPHKRRLLVGRDR